MAYIKEIMDNSSQLWPQTKSLSCDSVRSNKKVKTMQKENTNTKVVRNVIQAYVFKKLFKLIRDEFELKVMLRIKMDDLCTPNYFQIIVIA